VAKPKYAVNDSVEYKVRGIIGTGVVKAVRTKRFKPTKYDIVSTCTYQPGILSTRRTSWQEDNVFLVQESNIYRKLN